MSSNKVNAPNEGLLLANMNSNNIPIIRIGKRFNTSSVAFMTFIITTFGAFYDAYEA